MKTSRKRFRPAAGFTLLELLVALAITLVMAGLALAVTLGALDFWRQQQAAQVQAVAARQIFHLLERDLQAAMGRGDSPCSFAVDILDTTPALANHGWLTSARAKPAGGGSRLPLPTSAVGEVARIARARFGLSGVWLRFVTTNVESGGSLPTVVAYQMVRRPVIGDPTALNPAPVRYSLYRSAVSNADTVANGYDVTAPAYGSSNNTPSSALSTAYRHPRNVTNPSHANLLASNVVDWGCWLYVRDGAGELVRIYPAAVDDLSHHAAGRSVENESRFPEVIDVMVRVLSDEGAGIVAAMESGQLSRPPGYATDAEWWWSEVEANSKVFVRRVEIKALAP